MVVLICGDGIALCCVEELYIEL